MDASGLLVIDDDFRLLPGSRAATDFVGDAVRVLEVPHCPCGGVVLPSGKSLVAARVTEPPVSEDGLGAVAAVLQAFGAFPPEPHAAGFT